MHDQLFSNPKVLKRFHFGPLGNYIDSFAQILMMQGYQTSTAKHKIRIIAKLSRWLDQKGLGAKDLDETALKQYLLYKGRKGSIFKIGGNIGDVHWIIVCSVPIVLIPPPILFFTLAY